MIDCVLTRLRLKADIGKGPQTLTSLQFVFIWLIDTWPNDLGRFASLLTGAHVSNPFSKIDQPTKGADSSAPKACRLRG